MDEHQKNTDANVQDGGAASGEGKAKVIRAGSEANKSERQASRGNGAGNNPGSADTVKDAVKDAAEQATTEAARTIRRAGQQAMEGAGAVTVAAARVSEHMSEGIREQVREGMGGGEVLSEWTSFAQRAYARNMQAMGDLIHCYTPFRLLHWQANLFNATVVDWVETNARILQQAKHKTYAAMA